MAGTIMEAESVQKEVPIFFLRTRPGVQEPPGLCALLGNQPGLLHSNHLHTPSELS